MYEFAMGTEAQFDEFQQTLSDNLTHVYEVIFPSQITPSKATIGVYKAGENYALDLADYDKFSYAGDLQLPMFESLLRQGTISFLTFQDLVLFFRAMAVAFEPEGMTTAVINYYAENPYGAEDNLFQFQYQKRGNKWYAWIRRIPDLGERDPSLHKTHRLYDDETHQHYVCWTQPLKILHDAQTVSMLWADKILEYIATGKEFGGRGE